MFRKIKITTGLGIILFSGVTAWNDKEILELFDKKRFGIFNIFITENNKIVRIDLK